MAFEKVFDAGQATVKKFENVGDKIEGYYMGSFDFEGDYGLTKKHVFQTENGAELVFGQRHLIQQLPTIKPGTMVRVVYTEDLAPKKKGQHPMKLFSFEQDKKNTIDVVGVDSTWEAAADSAPEQEDTALADEVAPARAIRPATPAPAPSASAAQRLLAGRSKQSA